MGWQDTQMLTPEGVARERMSRRGGRADDAASVLVWVLGAMSLLLGAAGFGLILYYFWDVLSSLLRVVSLGGLMVLLWLGYGVSARLGWSSREVLGIFLCLSLLLIVLGLSQLLPGMPIWLLGLVYLGGSILVPVLCPARSSVTVLALTCLAEMALLWGHVRGSDLSADWTLLWTGVLSVLMMWSAVGSWCDVTPRRGYATFSALGAISSFLYMLAYQGMLLYPAYCRPSSLQGHTPQEQWLGMMLVWMLPMGFLLLVHRMRSRQRHRGFFSYSFLLYYAATLISLPLGLLLMERNAPLAGVAVMFGYAACLVYYGADYRLPRYVFFGCLLAFLTAIGIPLGLGADMVWSAVVMLALCAIFLAASLSLSRHRDNVFRRAQERRAGLAPSGPATGVPLRSGTGSGGSAVSSLPSMFSPSSASGVVAARTVPLSQSELSEEMRFRSDEESEEGAGFAEVPRPPLAPDIFTAVMDMSSAPDPGASGPSLAPSVPSLPGEDSVSPLRVPPLPGHRGERSDEGASGAGLSPTGAGRGAGSLPRAPEVPPLPGRPRSGEDAGAHEAPALPPRR